MDGFNVMSSSNRVQARYDAIWYIYSDDGMWWQKCGGGVDKTQVLAFVTAPSEKTLRHLISIVMRSTGFLTPHAEPRRHHSRLAGHAETKCAVSELLTYKDGLSKNDLKHKSDIALWFCGSVPWSLIII